MSVNTAVTAIGFQDRWVTETGRTPIGDVKRQDQTLELAFRRGIGPYFSFFVMPGVAYQHFSRDSDTSKDYVLPQSTLTPELELRLEAQRRGYELALWGRIEHRSSWEGFGLPEDEVSMTDIRDTPVRYGASFVKNVYMRSLNRVSTQFAFWDGQDLDRFSAYRPGAFPGVRLRGYDSKGIRFTRGFTGDVQYALRTGRHLRWDLTLGGGLFENPDEYGPGQHHAYGATLGVDFPVGRGFLMRVRSTYAIDSSLPVDGSRGSTRVMALKTFNGWWPWSRGSE